jgi:hypothetical protein
VFDVTQTDGPPLPAPPRPVLLPGAAPPGLWDALATPMHVAGYRLERGDTAPANGVTDHRDRTVIVHHSLGEAQAVKTLAHELGHVLLHQPDQLPAGFTRGRAEVEAESFAYLVTGAHGLDAGDYSAAYVLGWAHGDPQLVLATADRVITAARPVLTQLTPAPATHGTGPARAHGLAAGPPPPDAAANRDRNTLRVGR